MGGLWHCFTHTTRTTRNYMVKSINIYTHYKSINYGPIYELKNKLWTNNIRNYCTLEDHPIQELILQYLICWWVLYNTVYYYEPCQRKIYWNYWKIIPFSGWLVLVGSDFKEMICLDPILGRLKMGSIRLYRNMPTGPYKRRSGSKAEWVTCRTKLQMISSYGWCFNSWLFVGELVPTFMVGC